MEHEGIQFNLVALLYFFRNSFEVIYIFCNVVLLDEKNKNSEAVTLIW